MRMNVYSEYTSVVVDRNGERMVVPFCEIERGDYLPAVDAIADTDAEFCCDADYPGYVFYDTNGVGVFPEDVAL